MKKYLYLLLVNVLSMNLIYTQNCEITLRICEETKKDRDRLQRIWFILEHDTMPAIPYTKETYALPQKVCEAWLDTSKSVQILLETSKYMYDFGFPLSGRAKAYHLGEYCITKKNDGYKLQNCYSKRKGYYTKTIRGRYFLLHKRYGSWGEVPHPNAGRVKKIKNPNVFYNRSLW